MKFRDRKFNAKFRDRKFSEKRRDRKFSEKRRSRKFNVNSRDAAPRSRTNQQPRPKLRVAGKAKVSLNG